MRYFLAVIISSAFACSSATQLSERKASPKEQPATSNSVALSSEPSFNLLEIEHNQQKGRVQDNNIKVVSQIIEGGKESVPILIEKLTDETRTEEPFEDFWSYTTVGDIAFIILGDLFTDSTWTKATIQGTGWDEILGRSSPDTPGEQQLRNFIAKHGRSPIKAKWRRIWDENKDRVYWDEHERCFKNHLERPEFKLTSH
jgi:hypothetical protein